MWIGRAALALALVAPGCATDREQLDLARAEGMERGDAPRALVWGLRGAARERWVVAARAAAARSVPTIADPELRAFVADVLGRAGGADRARLAADEESLRWFTDRHATKDLDPDWSAVLAVRGALLARLEDDPADAFNAAVGSAYRASIALQRRADPDVLLIRMRGRSELCADPAAQEAVVVAMRDALTRP